MNKKKILSSLAILGILLGGQSSFGLAGGDLRLSQRNTDNTANLGRDIPLPATNACVGLDIISQTPRYFMLGSTLVFNPITGYMDVVAVSSSIVSGLATVATSGNYGDLINKPTIPAAQVSSDWNATMGISQIMNKPSLSTVATTGVYSDLTGKPTLFSGVYSDLTGKPSLFSGAYADLTGKPTLFSGAYADLTGKPSLATVATTGSYNDLTDKPSIPATQIQSDWNQVNTSALDYIKNKPSIPSIPVTSVFGRTGTITSNSGDYTTTQVTEGSNLYYTQTRFDTAFGNKSTSNLSEGTNLYFTSSRAIAAPLTGFASGTGTVSSTDSILSAIQKIVGNLALKFGSVTYTASTPTRTLNTNFTPSSTNAVQVCYSLNLTCTLSVAGSCNGQVELRSDTSATPTTVRGTIGNTLTLGVGIVVGTTVGGPQQLCYMVPPNHNVRLVSSGTITPTLTSQSEVAISFGQ